MNFEGVKQRGDGALDFRLEVEGWPVEWVTNARITHASGADGRQVHGGLSYDGIEIDERIVMAESLLQVKPIAFKITAPYKIHGASTQWTDDATYWLARELDPVERLGTALAYDGTTLAFESGAAWANGTVFFVNTETIRVTTWPTIERGLWGSQPQAHPIDHELPGNPAKYDVYVYTGLPPTMEGRRVFLHVYAEGDDPAGDGTVLWRGMIARVPYLTGGGDTGTWVLDCQNITHVLNQNVAGAIENAHIVGIYHHRLCPFVVEVKTPEDAFGVNFSVYAYTGIDASEADFIASINEWFGNLFSDIGGAVDGYFDFFGLVRTSDGLHLQATRSSDASIAFSMRGGSALVGFFDAATSPEPWLRTGFLPGTGDLDPSETYYIPLTMDAGFIAADVGYQYFGAPVTILGDCRPLFQPDRMQRFHDPSAVVSAPAWLLIVDVDMASVELVYIEGTRKPDGIFRVLEAGLAGTAYYIKVEPWYGPPGSAGVVGGAAGGGFGDPLANGGFLGYLGSDTVVHPIRSYDIGGIADFMRALKTAGRDFGNQGDTPFITDSDISDLEPDGSTNLLARNREYAFLKRIRVLDIITSELRFINHFLRLDAQGKIDSAKLPEWTEASAVDDLHTIDGGGILTQADGTGSAPKYTPNSDGRITMVSIRHRYRPPTDDYADAEAVFQAAHTIPITKGRGKSPEKIELVSTPIWPPTANDLPQLAAFAASRLAFFSRQYGVVEIEVPYTKFDVLCGDVVSLTHPDIPDAEGARGVTGRRGVVIGRNWNMDGAKARRGRLRIMVTPRGIVGYAPSGFIFDAVHVSGNTWTLHLPIDPGSDMGNFNLTMAGGAGGGIVAHFIPGDFVRAYRFDSYTPDVQTGVVQSVNATAHTVTVVFDGVFDPFDGAETLLTYALEFDRDTDGSRSTSSQDRYARQADEDALLPNGDFARRLA